MKKLILCILITMFFLMEICSANTITNSRDWKDVYSGMLAGSLTGEDTNFLVSDKHGILILNSISKESEVTVLSSRRNMFVIGYETIIENRGFQSVNEIFYNDFNLEIGEELVDITRFIVIDDSYGYNAISVAPYAVASNSWVLFADRNNIRDVEAFLADRDVNNLIIYGHVDREVRTRLAGYDPEIINIDGDRFLNNIEIVKKYQEINHAKQTVLTNGEFIEKEIMSGLEPVIFIGSNNVPDAVKEYVPTSEIDIGVLIGNELVGAATTIRREVGISVFVKFAQGARAPDAAISQVEALDMFYLPSYILNAEIESVVYNIATGMLEVTIRNTEDQAIYFKGTYALRDANGNIYPTFGDIDAIFLDANEIKTLTYDIEEQLPEGDLVLDAYVIYGESKGSMEKVIDDEFTVEFVEVYDECKIEDISVVFYDTSRKAFYVEIENIGDVRCYADVELYDVVVEGELTTIGSDVIEIRPGRKAFAIIKARLLEEDIEENLEISGRVHYGERENNLIKFKDFRAELTTKGINLWTFTLIPIIIILTILIIWKIRKKKKEEYRHSHSHH